MSECELEFDEFLFSDFLERILLYFVSIVFGDLLLSISFYCSLKNFNLSSKHCVCLDLFSTGASSEDVV